MSEKEFLEDLEEFLQKHPDQQRNFTIPSDKIHDISILEMKRCKRWGKLPGNNQLVCLEWEDI